jgi:hypothetical protein
MSLPFGRSVAFTAVPKNMAALSETADNIVVRGCILKFLLNISARAQRAAD